jgi:glycosyltransferase involved in cell wall biosynthesis
VVGYTPWEFTAIPPAWVYQFNQCEQVWTTSEWCKQVLEGYNLNASIEVLPHGISNDWSIEEREIGDKFYFLHVGGELPRKNVQLAVSAFLECFEGDEDYHLILKTSEGIENISLQPSLEELEAHPQITILNGFIPKDSLISLYKHSHCMIYPTAGEGFGMIPYQAIATGMPTICTELSGCSQFADMSMPLKATWGDPSEHDLDHHNLVGTGAQIAVPDYEDLCNLMRKAVDEYYKEKAKAMRSARVIHKYETWNHVADDILDFLKIS